MHITRCITGPYATNCYFLADNKTVALIDPGLGSGALLKAYLEENPDLVLRDIVLTHGHLDHSCEAAACARRYGAVVHIHEADAFMLNHGVGMPQHMRELFDAESMEPPDTVKFITDGQTLHLPGGNFRVLHAPGHSPGCIMLRGQEVMFSGDVLFKGSIGRMDLPFSDPDAMMRSLVDVVYPLDDALSVLPGHGDSTTMKHEKACNPFLKGLG